MTAVKICGLCRPQDALAAQQAGADYLGVILSPGTRRSQSAAAAAAIFAAAGAVRRVGVFVNAQHDDVLAAVRQLGLDVVQLHGQEPAGLVRALSEHAEVWKAVAVREPSDIAQAAAGYPHAAALLLDAFHAQHAGGSGSRLNWSELVDQRQQLPAGLRMVLAGGLNPTNVAQAIRILAPQIVDVSSGVEQTLGEKSVTLMQSFVSAAREASLVTGR